MWERFYPGRVSVSVDPSNTLINAARKTFGAANLIVPYHTHTGPSHTHSVTGQFMPQNIHTVCFAAGGGTNPAPTTLTTGAAGTGNCGYAGAANNQVNANYQPSVAVHEYLRTE